MPRVGIFLAEAMASGFEILKPRPWAKVSQAHGLAYFTQLGLASDFWAKPAHHYVLVTC